MAKPEYLYAFGAADSSDASSLLPIPTVLFDSLEKLDLEWGRLLKGAMESDGYIVIFVSELKKAGYSWVPSCVATPATIDGSVTWTRAKFELGEPSPAFKKWVIEVTSSGRKG